MSKQLKPIIHGRDHAADGADPIPGLGGGWADPGDYESIQEGIYSRTGTGTPSDQEITGWPRITITAADYNAHGAATWGMWARWYCEVKGFSTTLGDRVDMQPIDHNLPDAIDAADPVTADGWIQLEAAGWLDDVGARSTAVDIQTWMRNQSQVVGPLQVRNGRLALNWLTATDTPPSTDYSSGGAGPPGPEGPAGPAGPAGPGVPTGGTAGQILTKDTATDYDTSWQPAAGGGGVTVKEDGVVAGTRAGINFHEGAAVANSYGDIASTYTNYTALKQSSGIGITLADDPANNEVDVTLTAGGSLASGGGVTVLNYTEKTTPVTVSATTEAGGTTIITAASVVVPASTLICVEFYCPNATTGTNTFMILNLWQDSAAIGRIFALGAGGVGMSTAPGIFARRFFTPGAGTYSFSIRGWRGSADGTIVAGAGGSAAYFPMYIRITSGG